jgi:hypothetical protein
MIFFWPFYHTGNLLNSHRKGDFPFGHPSSKCFLNSHRKGDFPFGHPSSKYFRPSTLNFQVPFAWVTPTLVITCWYYYPFNPYKPYVCECRSVYVRCVCVHMWVCVCAHVSMCVCAKIRKISKKLKKFKKFKKSQNIQKISKFSKNPHKW